MKKIKEEKLDGIVGGTTGVLTAPLVNAFVSVIKLLTGAGRDVGSSIRRIATGNMCPLK